MGGLFEVGPCLEHELLRALVSLEDQVGPIRASLLLGEITLQFRMKVFEKHGKMSHSLDTDHP